MNSAYLKLALVLLFGIHLTTSESFCADTSSNKQSKSFIQQAKFACLTIAALTTLTSATSIDAQENDMPSSIMFVADKQTYTVPKESIILAAKITGRDYKKFTKDSFINIPAGPLFEEKCDKKRFLMVFNGALEQTEQKEVSAVEFEQAL